MIGFGVHSRKEVWGLRAAAGPPIAHYDRRRLDTIRKLVQVWAPPNENDTEAYARCVTEASGFGIDEPLDLHDYACLRPVLTAMIRVENGRQPYTDAQIDAALVRAGVMPPQRSLQETRTVKAGGVAAAGTIGAGALGAIRKPSARRTRRWLASCRTSMRRMGRRRRRQTLVAASWRSLAEADSDDEQIRAASGAF